MTPQDTAPGRDGGRLQEATGLVLALVVLAAATVAGAVLFAVAEGGYASFPWLILHVGVPGAVALVLAVLVSMPLAGARLARAVLVGVVAGLVGTVGLEIVRETGFRVFSSMPGDITMLMGVLLKSQIMHGPDLGSDIVGWADHFWNGAMFGVIYAVLLGGFPRRKGPAPAVMMGVVWGLILATGFLISPVPVAVGAGSFGIPFGAKFAITVYLAHAVFGAIVGLLVHRMGRSVQPIWGPLHTLMRRRSPTAASLDADSPPEGRPGTGRHGTSHAGA